MGNTVTAASDGQSKKAAALAGKNTMAKIEAVAKGV